SGGDVEKLLDKYKMENRDNARTPMQWDDSVNGGFTEGQPWFPVNPNYKTINVKEQLSNEHSVLNFYKKLIKLKKSDDIYTYGQFDLVDADNSKIFAYTRTLGDKTVVVAANLTKTEAKLNLPFDITHAKIKLHNYPSEVILEKVQPYECFVAEL
ncbi:TPA: alpha-glucosidase C-terminal domain-containing protein, partial [Staphylococcus aureus]|nr:alpha-glucosidase C-terminal domain-containing protein [Staphylococcus aureus]